MKKKLLSIVLSLGMILSTLEFVQPVYADSQRIITLGADLSDEQRQTVLAFFGVSEEDLSTIDVITITNEDEHDVLDGIVANNVIGTHTYSCAYIEPTFGSGINIKTANLTYVTANSLYNALQTAGVENCNLVVTAPFEVSGTGALTGVFKAYEQQGKALDEDKQELAAEELIIDAQLENTYGEDSTNLVTDVKGEIVDTPDKLDAVEIQEIIESKAEEYDIELDEDDTASLVSLMEKLQTMEYDTDTFKQKLDEIQSNVEEKAEQGKGVLAKIGNFFKILLYIVFGGAIVLGIIIKLFR